MSAHKNRKKEYFDGVKAALPVILGFVPVGIAYAVMVHDAGFSALETVLMSLLVFAGASQMMAVGMYAQGADHEHLCVQPHGQHTSCPEDHLFSRCHG